MKYKGRKLTGPAPKTVSFIRDGNIVDLTVEAVLDYDPFDTLCPFPKAPMKLLPGNKKIEDLDNEAYKSQLNERGQKLSAWVILTALRNSGLEWDRVVYTDHTTWLEWEKELRESFTAAEINKLLNAISEVNGMNEEAINEARKSFLAMQEALNQKPSSPTEGHQTISSGVPASESGSSLQESKV